jgi:predicted  nucleic acid-binding Zn-ribbon protein
MEKLIKIILFIIVGIALVNLATTLFSNSNLKGIQQDLEKAKRSADSALVELQFSKSRLDSIRADIVVFKSYINNVQKRVALNDAEKQLRETRDQDKADSIKQSIQQLRDKLAKDSLPNIESSTLKRTKP